MLVGVIVGCEVAFWVFVIGGVAARYGLRRERLGAALLVCAPLADVVLLSVTAVDLAHGAEATTAHGLAAAYLGFSVAYGHALVRWADARGAHWRDGVPLPPKRYGSEYAADCLRDVLRALVALAVTAAVVGLLHLVAAPGTAGALMSAVQLVGAVVVIDVLWWLSYEIWPRRERSAAREPVSSR